MSYALGHYKQTRIFKKGIPKEIANKYSNEVWKDFVYHWSVFPDRYRQYVEIKVDPLARYYVEQLHNHNIDTHSADAVELAFRLMTRDFSLGEDRRALMWAATIQHFLGDASDTRHTIIARIFIEQLYSLCFNSIFADSGKPIRTVLPYFDFANFYKNPIVQEKIHREIKGYCPRIFTHDPDEGALIAHLSYYMCWTYLNEQARKTIALSQEFVRTNDLNVRNEMDLSASLAAIKSTQISLDLLRTSYDMARAGKVSFNEEIIKKSVARHVENHITTQDLNSTVSYYNLVQTQTNHAAIGVIIEYPFMWEQGTFQYPSSFVQGMIMRQLRRFGTKYKVFRDTDFNQQIDLNPKIVQILILFSGGWNETSFSSARRIDESLYDYLQAGGKILWLGGRPPRRAWGGIEKCMEVIESKGKPSPMPFGPKDFSLAELTPVTDSMFGRLGRLKVKKSFAKEYGDFPPINFHFMNNAEVHPLMELNLSKGGDKYIVAAEFKVGLGKVVYMPYYMLLPLVFTDENEICSLVDPEMDLIGIEIFNESLRLLGISL